MAMSRRAQLTAGILVGCVVSASLGVFLGTIGDRATRSNDQHDVSIMANMPRGCSYHRIRRAGYSDLLLIRCLEGIAFIH